jgi:hypothetical protein
VGFLTRSQQKKGKKIFKFCYRVFAQYKLFRVMTNFLLALGLLILACIGITALIWLGLWLLLLHDVNEDPGEED